MSDELEVDIELGCFLALVLELNPFGELVCVIGIGQEVLSGCDEFILGVFILVPYLNNAALVAISGYSYSLLHVTSL